jgi:hypothetical protein
MPAPAAPSKQPARGRARRAALAALTWLLPEHNPGGAVYGIIAVGALLAAEGSVRETYPETVGSVAIAIVMYWLAEAYAHLLGTRMKGAHRLSLAETLHTLGEDWPIVTGASLPLITLLGAWAAGAPQRSAVTAGVITAAGSLVLFELAAGLRAHDRARALFADAAVGIAMGLGILALRALT